MAVDLKTESDALAKVPMFAKLDPSRLRLLAFTSQLLTVEDKEILFEQGDVSDSAYLVMSGEMEVLVGTGDDVAVAGLLKVNDLVGEMGVLANAPRSATIRARGRAHVLRIEGDMFLKLLADNSSVSLDVMRQLSEKLARSHKQFERLREEVQRMKSSADHS